MEIHPTIAAGLARAFLEFVDPGLLPFALVCVLLVAAFVWYTRTRNAYDTAARADLDARNDDLQATNKDLHERLEAVKAERDRANDRATKADERTAAWQDRYYQELERRLGHPVARPEVET